jgi:hypothetical protein
MSRRGSRPQTRHKIVPVHSITTTKEMGSVNHSTSDEENEVSHRRGEFGINFYHN